MAEIGNRRSGERNAIPPYKDFTVATNVHGEDRESAEWTKEVHSALQGFHSAGTRGTIRRTPFRTTKISLGGDARHDQANAIPLDEGFRNRKIGFACQPVGQVPFPNNHSVNNSRLLTVRCHEPCYIPVIIVLDNPCLRILSDLLVPEDFESIHKMVTFQEVLHLSVQLNKLLILTQRGIF